MNKSEILYACSKCFTRHPFEELSQGQQLCKKCRGDFPVVKCTYCRSEFQQESKSKTSSICKRCEQCVSQYGKPTSCSFCQLPAAFVGGKCQRCSSYYKRYGPPKTCEQCKQKSAFDRGDNAKLMCWACSCSYKRALAKTKQSDPARHSRVFKKEKPQPNEEDKAKKREKYLNSKKPNRPDVTKIEAGDSQPPTKIVKRERGEGDTDHVGEITQLKERIAALEKQSKQKDIQLIQKDQEITQMRAKLFNEEKLIREKMKKMSSAHEDKVADLQNKIRSLQSEIAKLRKDSKPLKTGKKVDNLFKDSSKKLVSSRTASPLSRSRSKSPVRSPLPAAAAARSRSGSRSSVGSRSPSPPPDKKAKRSESPAPTPAAETKAETPPRSPVPAIDSVVQQEDEEEEMEIGSSAVVPEDEPATVRNGSPHPSADVDEEQPTSCNNGENSRSSSVDRSSSPAVPATHGSRSPSRSSSRSRSASP